MTNCPPSRPCRISAVRTTTAPAMLPGPYVLRLKSGWLRRQAPTLVDLGSSGCHRGKRAVTGLDDVTDVCRSDHTQPDTFRLVTRHERGSDIHHALTVLAHPSASARRGTGFKRRSWQFRRFAIRYEKTRRYDLIVSTAGPGCSPLGLVQDDLDPAVLRLAGIQTGGDEGMRFAISVDGDRAAWHAIADELGLHAGRATDR